MRLSTMEDEKGGGGHLSDLSQPEACCQGPRWGLSEGCLQGQPKGPCEWHHSLIFHSQTWECGNELDGAANEINDGQMALSILIWKMRGWGGGLWGEERDHLFNTNHFDLVETLQDTSSKWGNVWITNEFWVEYYMSWTSLYYFVQWYSVTSSRLIWECIYVEQFVSVPLHVFRQRGGGGVVCPPYIGLKWTWTH